jgi:hypothetical protein
MVSPLQSGPILPSIKRQSVSAQVVRGDCATLERQTTPGPSSEPIGCDDRVKE